MAMTAAAPKSRHCQTDTSDASLQVATEVIEELLEGVGAHLFDAGHFEALARELLVLHARVRSHHAAGELTAAQSAVDIPPEYARDIDRLRDEHSEMIGRIDRIIRATDSIVDQTLEDKEVFVLRGRELLAMLRRHEAEEDRLFYLAVWRDVGGES